MQADEDNFGLMRELPKSRRNILAGAFAAFLFGGKLSLKSPHQFAYAYSEDYEKDTLEFLAKTKAFIANQNDYEDVYESYMKWNTKYSVPGAVDTKRFGKSFLLTTKIFSLVKGGDIDGVENKANEWVNVASALTDGSLSGKEAKDTYGNLVWANNDKSDPKNRIGLCAFGEPAGTKFFNINCDGF